MSDTPSPKESAPKRARGLRWPLWLALGLVALVLAAWAAVAVLFPPARVRAVVETQLSRTLAREVAFEGASVSLWPPVRLRVRGLKLAEPGGLSQGAGFEARSLDLDLDVLALLARRLVVSRLVIEGPALHLAIERDGRTNFDGVMKPPPAGPAGTPGAPSAPAAPFDLAVRTLEINGGQVRVEDSAAGRRVAFGLDSRLGFSLEGGGERVATEGETRIGGLSVGPLAAARPQDLDRSLAKIEWRIGHRGKYDTASRRLALERLAIGAGRAEITLVGVVDDVPGATVADLRAQGGNVDLAQVLDALAAADARALAGVQGGGRLDFDLAVRGPLAPGAAARAAAGGASTVARPVITGTITVANGTFRYPGAPAGVEALSFTARLGPDSLAIADLAARVSGQPVGAELEMSKFADPAVRFAVRGDLDLAAVAPLVTKDARLGGRAALDVRGRGRAKQPEAMALEGRARLAGVSVESPALPKKIDQVGGEIEFSAARAEIRGLSVRAGQSSFTLDGTVTRPLALVAKPGGDRAGAGGGSSGAGAGRARAAVEPSDVSFTLRSPHLDLAELLPVTPGSPVLPNARGSGRVEIGRLIHQKLDVTNVAARLALTPGVLEVPEFSFDGYGGAVRGTGRFDLSNPAKPVYAVRARVDTVEADRLLSAWTPARGLLHGALNTTLDFSGEGATPDDIKRSLTAVGLAGLANGTLGPGPTLEALAQFTQIPELKQVKFRDMKLPFRVERGRVITDPVVLTGSNGDWRASGGIGFDGSLDYAVSTTLPPEVVEKLGATAALAAGALADEKGRILIDLRVTGSARSPRIDWDRKAMGERAKGQLSSTLEKQRAKLEAELIRSLAPQSPAPGDSAAAAVDEKARRRALEDSLKSTARGLLDGLLRRSKSDTTKR